MTFIPSKSSALHFNGGGSRLVLVNAGINAKARINKTSTKGHSKVRQLNLPEFKPHKIVSRIGNRKIFVVNWLFYPENQFVESKKFKVK